MTPGAAALLAALALAGCDRPVHRDSGAPISPGATGGGTADSGGGSQPPQAGKGLTGGLGGSGIGMTGSFPAGNTSTQSSGAGAATEGSPNRTTKSSVGNR